MTQPKKRVYELARELNLTNKSLLEKISSLDLGLNSHMSTLTDEIEARIRQFIKGGPAPSLVEKRVKPTVIRRRRKVVKPPKEEVEAAPAEEVEATATTEPALEEEAPEEAAEPVEEAAATPEPAEEEKTPETEAPAEAVEAAAPEAEAPE
jgi:translation initiation factor IF-2